MARTQLNICYLTKKQNVIARIASTLNGAFPQLTASQESGEASIKGTPDLIIADKEFANIAVDSPILFVIPSEDVPLYTNRGKTNFITEDEMFTHALVRAAKSLIEQNKLTNSLKEATIKDELTSLYNKNYLSDILGREVKKSNRYRTPLTLLYFGIDGLKKINEKYGHSTGDRVIIDLGLILANSVREVDIVGRFVGDEFLAILPETPPNDTLRVCARIQHAVKNFAFVSGMAGISVTVSIGIAGLTGEIRTKEGLIESVRTALSGAKKRGTDSVCTWDEASTVSRPLEEDKKLILTLQEEIAKLTENAKRAHFDDIMKMLEELPLHKKLFPHSERVAFYSEKLASKLGVGTTETNTIKYAAFLHDIGKVALDELVVLKETTLSGIEYAFIKQHPVIAAQILTHSIFMKNEINMILHHHEKYDGSGYPDGLQGRHIPIGSRIIGLAESWDTMITAQVYRDALPLDQALTELKKGAGKQFDPELVAVFTGLIEG